MRLNEMGRLDTMITVVDAMKLLQNYSSHDFLTTQVEFAGASYLIPDRSARTKCARSSTAWPRDPGAPLYHDNKETKH